MQTIERNRIMVHIKCFFTPEIGWDNTWYNVIYEYVKNDNNLKALLQNNDKKFLEFIKTEPSSDYTLSFIEYCFKV